jgi:hypothetical protein
MHPVRLLSLPQSGTTEGGNIFFVSVAGCELSSLHLQPARRLFVNCSDQRPRPCLGRRTYSGTTQMKTNPWTSRRRYNRRCSSSRKIYGLDNVVVVLGLIFYYFLSIHLSTYGLLALDCCLALLCAPCCAPYCRCMHVSIPMLCCYCVLFCFHISLMLLQNTVGAMQDPCQRQLVYWHLVNSGLMVRVLQ